MDLTFWNGITLPDQDPMPGAIQQEYAESLAFEHRFEIAAWVAAALAILVLAAFIYGWKHRRRPTHVQGKK
ncbi:MAG: hypothetical protein WA890_27855 [Micromonospora sp.]